MVLVKYESSSSQPQMIGYLPFGTSPLGVVVRKRFSKSVNSDNTSTVIAFVVGLFSIWD